MGKARNPNLSDEDIAVIVRILDGWSGDLTWDRLIAAVERRLHRRYTRQALDKHLRIKSAFQNRKKEFDRDEPPKEPARSAEIELALQRIAVLEAAMRRLERENMGLLEQFARWAYNAHTRGLDEDFLNQSLPTVDREATRLMPEPVGGKNGSGTKRPAARR